MNNNDNNLRYNSPNNNMPAENDLSQNFSRTSPPSQNLYNNNNSMNNNPNNNTIIIIIIIILEHQCHQ
jgi:hypothetical protein